jgi:alkylation response protein AidB-like acyl-CoA dehydrogenase
MRFGLTEDQSALRDMVRAVLSDEWTTSDLRAASTAEPGDLDRGIWSLLDDLGVLGVLVPEDRGGLGLDECTLVPILEETGRAALPHPIVETAMVAAPLGVSGMVATDLGGRFVPCGADADVLLLRRGQALRAYHPDEVKQEFVVTVDGARRATAIVPVGPGSLVADDPAEIATAQLRGIAGTAAQLLGLSRRMLDLTVAYVSDRRQFGVPVGSFQAVKHQLADTLVRVEFALPAVRRAAHSLASGAPEAARDVSMAKALAIDAATLAGRTALQCHGAIGYTVEYELHLFLKRTWALSRSWGDRAFHAEVVATSLEESM